MDKGLAVLLTAAVGGLLAAQAPTNSGLGRVIGTFQAAFLSFVVGALVLAAIAALARGGLGRIGELRGVPWYFFAGGVLGALYVTTSLVTVRSLGAGGVVAATISGQLAMGVVIDALGLFGVAKAPVTPGKLAGVALLAGGTWLVVRE